MSQLLIFDGETINLANPTAAQYNALWNLHNTWKRRHGHMPLNCTNPHGGDMYTKVLRGQLWVAHYPGHGDQSCTRRLNEPESPAHHHIKEYGARAAQAAGFAVREEHRLISHDPHSPRADLFVDAPFPFSLEAQISPITPAKVKSRTTRSARAGAPPVWVFPESWSHPYVPVVGFNRDTDWTPGVPPRGTVTALHMKHVVAGHCTVTGEFNHCPHKRSGFCGGWHPHYEALRGWTLDDAIAGVGDREVHMLQTAGPKRSVLLVPTAGLTLYRELTGLDGVFMPAGPGKPRKPVDELGPRECTADRPPALYDECMFCPHELWAPISQIRGVCEHHWLALQPDKHPIQLPLIKEIA